MRKLKKDEYNLIVFMLKEYPAYQYSSKLLEKVSVEEMKDGGMGSLRFIDDRKEIIEFYRELVIISVLDVDQIPISFSLNIDQFGNLFERDVFKADFSPLKKFPVVPYNLLPPPQII